MGRRAQLRRGSTSRTVGTGVTGPSVEPGPLALASGDVGAGAAAGVVGPAAPSVAPGPGAPGPVPEVAAAAVVVEVQQ